MHPLLPPASFSLVPCITPHYTIFGFVGVEKEAEYLQMSVARHDAFLFRAADWRERISDLKIAAAKQAVGG